MISGFKSQEICIVLNIKGIHVLLWVRLDMDSILEKLQKVPLMGQNHLFKEGYIYLFVLYIISTLISQEICKDVI